VGRTRKWKIEHGRSGLYGILQGTNEPKKCLPEDAKAKAVYDPPNAESGLTKAKRILQPKEHRRQSDSAAAIPAFNQEGSRKGLYDKGVPTKQRGWG